MGLLKNDTIKIFEQLKSLEGLPTKCVKYHCPNSYIQTFVFEDEKGQLSLKVDSSLNVIEILRNDTTVTAKEISSILMPVKVKYKVKYKLRSPLVSILGRSKVDIDTMYLVVKEDLYGQYVQFAGEFAHGTVFTIEEWEEILDMDWDWITEIFHYEEV